MFLPLKGTFFRAHSIPYWTNNNSCLLLQWPVFVVLSVPFSLVHSPFMCEVFNVSEAWRQTQRDERLTLQFFDVICMVLYFFLCLEYAFEPLCINLLVLFNPGKLAMMATSLEFASWNVEICHLLKQCEESCWYLSSMEYALQMISLFCSLVQTKSRNLFS